MRAAGLVLIIGVTFAGCLGPVAEPDAGAVDAGGVDGSVAPKDAGFSGRLWFMQTSPPTVAQVFVQSPFGSAAILVSAPDRDARSMAVSADGDLIAISYSGASQDISVGPTDGGPARIVWSEPAAELNLLALSPDKGQLAFYETDDAGWGGVLILPLDGGTAFEATPLAKRTSPWTVSQGEFSSSSRFFGVVDLGPDAGLYVTDTANRDVTRVGIQLSQTDSIFFDWYSNDRFVGQAVSSRGAASPLFVCSTPDACVERPEILDAGLHLVKVSDDGSFMVLMSRSVDAGVVHGDVFRAPLDGGAPTQLTSIGDFAVPFSTPMQVRIPDNERLVALALTQQDLTIYLISTTGLSVPTPLCVFPWMAFQDPWVDSHNPFSPDRRHMVFRTLSTGPYLWRIDLETPLQTPNIQQQVGFSDQFEWTP